jgi:phage terminase large subunit
MKLNPKLKAFWKTKAKVKVLHGGRASSKTEDTAGILIYLASKYKLKS